MPTQPMFVSASFRGLVGSALLLAAAACGGPSAALLEGAGTAESMSDVAYVRVPIAALTPEVVRATGFNRDHKRDDVYAFGYVKRDRLSALPESAQADVVELDAKSGSHHDFDAKTLAVLPEAAPTKEVFEDYHHYDQLTAELQRLATEHPDIATLESAGKSVRGRELWVLKISDNAAAEENEPKLLYIANMHGDETVGREMMIYLARRLVTDYGTDPRITKLVDSSQIYIMPSMNPDGFEMSQRYNANSVDLNRDFPDFTADPTDTPAGRAPETAAVMALHAKHHFLMAINFHGGEVCFNAPWDTKANTTDSDRFGDDPIMQLVGHQYADSNPTMKANDSGSFDHGVTYGYEWYEVDGGMQDWSIYYRGSMHATVELSYTKYPAASQLPGMWAENKEALVAYLEAGAFGMHLRLVDQAGAPVNGATVRVASLDRDVVYANSFVHRPAIAGAQNVKITAPGYAAANVTLTPWNFGDAGYQDVVLTK